MEPVQDENDFDIPLCSLLISNRSYQRIVGAAVRRRVYRKDLEDRNYWIMELYDFIDNEQQLLVRKNDDGITVSPNKFTLGVIKKKATITDYHSNPIEINIILRILPDPKQSTFESIKIFPNPTSGSFTIEDIQMDFLIIYNSEGKVCLEKRLDESDRKNAIQVNHLNKGTYRLVLYDNNQIIAIKTLIII